MSKKLVSLFLAVLMVFSIGASLAEGSAITVTDMHDREITLTEPATRIVVMQPSDCEILCAIGCEDTIVGRGQYVDYPASILNVPVVQSGAETNIEEILALNPQVVLMNDMSQSEEQVKQLEENGVKVVVSSATDIEGVYYAIRMIGKLMGKDAEAEAVIAELQRRCHDKKDSKLSVGVVTFNINQQNLIDDLLNEACKEDNMLENWVYNSKEPLFIKNLENVQGDERDVILFSIGYGPDKDGHVSMNFGPLNRDGGWRRLNVAVSRARCEMVVFSTIEPEMIDLNRTHAEGVAALRSFLEYASGRDHFGDGYSAAGGNSDTEGVSKAICAELAKKGYETERNVGHSQYRIDIGVIDPNDPERYLLGILLDGSTYRNSKTVRDRELAQISVLASLGWRITRVWSMDWWDNSRKELTRILALLDEAVEQSHTEEEEQDVTMDDQQEQPLSQESENDLTEQVQKTELPSEEEQEIIPEDTPSDLSPNVVPYQSAELKSISLSADDFVQPACKKMVKDAVKSVIETEAPVSEARLSHRVIQSFGITRSTAKIQNHLSELIASLALPSTIQYEDRFIWKKDQNPDEYILIRRNGEGDCKRDVKEIPQQEAANAVCLVLHEQISMSRDDLVRESAKLMNFTRLSSNVSAVFEAAVQSAESKGLIATDENGTCRLSESGNEFVTKFNL